VLFVPFHLLFDNKTVVTPSLQQMFAVNCTCKLAHLDNSQEGMSLTTRVENLRQTKFALLKTQKTYFLTHCFMIGYTTQKIQASREKGHQSSNLCF
jgi:hypothetical protein